MTEPTTATELDTELAAARRELADAEDYLRTIQERRLGVNADSLARYRVETARRRVMALMAARHDDGGGAA